MAGLGSDPLGAPSERLHGMLIKLFCKSHISQNPDEEKPSTETTDSTHKTRMGEAPRHLKKTSINSSAFQKLQTLT